MELLYYMFGYMLGGYPLNLGLKKMVATSNQSVPVAWPLRVLGKSPFAILGTSKSNYRMIIFNSHVKLPEGYDDFRSFVQVPSSKNVVKTMPYTPKSPVLWVVQSIKHGVVSRHCFPNITLNTPWFMNQG